MPGANGEKTQAELDAEAAEAEKNKTKTPPAGQGGNGDSGTDDSKLSLEDALKVIKDLRGENAKHRTNNKSLEGTIKQFGEQLGSIKKHLNIKDDVDPAEQIKTLSSTNEALEFENSLHQVARANNIPIEQDNYFRFLMSREVGKLKDDEQLSEETIAEIVEEVQKVSGSSKEKPNGNSTGVNENGGGKNKPANGGDGELTPEKFVKMTLIERSKLFTDNKPEYDRLLQAAKDKKLF